MKRILRLLTLGAFLSSVHAADVPISGLPAASTATGTEVLPVVQGGVTKKMTVAGLAPGLPAATSSVAGTMAATDKAKLDAATAANTVSTLVARDSSGNFAAGTITASSVTGLASPVNATDAANKSYVDAAAAGLVIKTPAVAATVSSNVTLSGGTPTTLDGVTLHANDRILVKNQSDDKQNGIYYVSTLGSGSNGTWTRTTDADTGAKLVTGSYVFITGGTINVNSAWTMVTPGTITIGTSSITWNLFSQITQIQAANIIGQIVGSQVQDAAINTAKFAAGLTPVEILASLPVSANFQGRMVFLTSDNKLYRYNGSAFTAIVPTTDLSGQITTTQITDTAITAPKMAANSITAGTIAAGAVTSGTIAANAVVAGTIQAGAVNTAELAAGAVNASKIAAGTITSGLIAANTIVAGNIASGTITADRLNISSLSAISANIGTITAGTITSSASISVGSGTSAVSISSAGFTVAGGRITMTGDGTNPYIRVIGAGAYAAQRMELNASNGAVNPYLVAVNSSGNTAVNVNPTGIYVGTGSVVTIDTGAVLNGPGQINLFGGNADALSIVAGEDGSVGSLQGYMVIKLNSRTVKVPFYNP